MDLAVSSGLKPSFIDPSFTGSNREDGKKQVEKHAKEDEGTTTPVQQTKTNELEKQFKLLLSNYRAVYQVSLLNGPDTQLELNIAHRRLARFVSDHGEFQNRLPPKVTIQRDEDPSARPAAAMYLTIQTEFEGQF